MPTFPARRGEPDATYSLSLEGGRQVAITTDASGLVSPVSADEAAVADHHGLATEAPTTAKARRARSTETAPDDPAEEA